MVRPHLMDIALYGGSFDPPHIGHIKIINKALEVLDIEKLIVVPTFVNPFKQGTHAPAPLRVQWLETIFKETSNVEVSSFEVDQKRAVTSIETVEHYKKVMQNIYFIIGADNLEKLTSWSEFERLDSLVTWVIAKRDKIAVDKKFITLDIDEPVSSTTLRNKINQAQLPQEVALSIKTFFKEHHARTHS